jgi:hypothetical protein
MLKLWMRTETPITRLCDIDTNYHNMLKLRRRTETPITRLCNVDTKLRMRTETPITRLCMVHMNSTNYHESVTNYQELQQSRPIDPPQYLLRWSHFGALQVKRIRAVT